MGPAIANAAVAQGGQTPAPRARFGLYAPNEVHAGERITIEIKRMSNDGRAHDFQLVIKPAEMLREPPEQPIRFVIDDANPGWTREFATVDAPPGELPQRLIFYLSPGESRSVINPRAVSVSIIPKAPTEPTTNTGPVVNGVSDGGPNSEPTPLTFAVRAPDGAISRGDPVAFAVTRIGGSGQQRVNFNLTQGDRLLTTGQLVFNEGGAPQSPTFTGYNKCGDPLTLQLLGAEGDTRATAAFSSEMPGDCPRPPTWEEIFKKWWPVALLLPLGWLAVRTLRWIFRPRIRKGFGVRLGESSFPGGEPLLRLPQVERSVGVAMGQSNCPNPLPLRETIDE